MKLLKILVSLYSLIRPAGNYPTGEYDKYYLPVFYSVIGIVILANVLFLRSYPDRNMTKRFYFYYFKSVFFLLVVSVGYGFFNLRNFTEILDYITGDLDKWLFLLQVGVLSILYGTIIYIFITLFLYEVLGNIIRRGRLYTLKNAYKFWRIK